MRLETKERKTRQHPFFSIIIPARNSNSQYLGNCLYSLRANSFLDYEVLVVFDDHGPCLSDYTLDDRFRCISINHVVSVGEARNLGMDQASGAYILFVDSDDEVEEHYLEVAHQIIQKQPDTPVVFDFNADKSWGRLDAMTTSVVATSGLHPVLMGFLGGIPVVRTPPYYSVWGKIFPASLLKLNSILFPAERMTGEDTLFVTHAIWLSEYVVEVNGYRPYYYRNNHPHNTMGNLSIEKLGAFHHWAYIDYLSSRLPISNEEQEELRRARPIYLIRYIREKYCLLTHTQGMARSEKLLILRSLVPPKKTKFWYQMKEKGELKFSQKMERFMLIHHWLRVYSRLVDRFKYKT